MKLEMAKRTTKLYAKASTYSYLEIIYIFYANFLKNVWKMFISVINDFFWYQAPRNENLQNAKLFTNKIINFPKQAIFSN